MTSKCTKLAIDCADPHDLARFWCSVLDFEVQDEDDRIVTIGSPMVHEGKNHLHVWQTCDGSNVDDSQVLLTPPWDFDDVEYPTPVIELVELDEKAGVWAGAFLGCPDAYASAGEVIAALTSRPPDDPWVSEVVATLSRDREWARWWGPSSGRLRNHLEIIRGQGERVHATATANRESIRRHGLDWNRMGLAPGIAGSTTPELPAIFVCQDLEDVSFMLHMARVPTDIWSIDVDGIWLENGLTGWEVISHPIGTDRLTLLVPDIPVGGFNTEPAGHPESQRITWPTPQRRAESRRQPRRRNPRI